MYSRTDSPGHNIPLSIISFARAMVTDGPLRRIIDGVVLFLYFLDDVVMGSKESLWNNNLGGRVGLTLRMVDDAHCAWNRRGGRRPSQEIVRLANFCSRNLAARWAKF